MSVTLAFASRLRQWVVCFVFCVVCIEHSSSHVGLCVLCVRAFIVPCVPCVSYTGFDFGSGLCCVFCV